MCDVCLCEHRWRSGVECAMCVCASTGGGTVTVLKQAHSSGPQKHRLEFCCESDAEVTRLLQQLRLLEDLQCAAVRSVCVCGESHVQ